MINKLADINGASPRISKTMPPLSKAHSKSEVLNIHESHFTRNYKSLNCNGLNR